MQDASKPIWINKTQQPVASSKDPIIFVATPVHSDVSMHYTQALLEFQKACFKKNILVSFCLMKSSLVTQGRNLCVSNMFEEPVPYTHFVFIDSDIHFSPQTIFTMIEKDKDVIACPYPMKTINWDKLYKRDRHLPSKDGNHLSRRGFTYPVKLENQEDIKVYEGVAEVTHVPTGCTVIKRAVFEKMFEAYPNLKINQPHLINGRYADKPYFYNLFDTYHEPKTKLYYGEDFGFCKRWTEIGGKCHIYVNDEIAHVGEYQYIGRIKDEFEYVKPIDESNKN
tara:strand:+ start:131 stop:973 length:843 start_codon:yes stop_codon:yes gene_type:complete